MADTLDDLESPASREFEPLAVRSLRPADLDAVVRIDKRIIGRSRRSYFEVKLKEALNNARLMVSLAVDIDGHLAGYLMGRLYYGEFGVPEPVAILDTIGVDPEHPREGIGRALMDQFRRNLNALGIERIQTEAQWNDWALIRFLDASGFEPARRICLDATV
jgi:ribosomal protein S18 acetylase RimI-like enzyme